MTLLKERLDPVGPMRCFDLEISRVEDLSEHFRRLTFVGEDIDRFAALPDGSTLDLRIKIIIPAAGMGQQPLHASDGSLHDDWYVLWRESDPSVRGVMRTYTVRELRRDSSGRVVEMDIDFVLHLADPAHAATVSGPAAEWAANAQVGDIATIIGPCADWDGPVRGIEFNPGQAPRVLLVGDETAVPAIAAILESLPPQIVGHAVLEVPASSDFLDISTPADIQIRWHARNGKPHGELIEADVRSIVQPAACTRGNEPEEVDIDAEILWETPQEAVSLGLYAWIAGEAAAVRSLRRYLVRDVGMDRRAVAFMGYWRLGSALPE